MNEKKVIEICDIFVEKYRFLSNFYPCQIIYEDIEYPSVEHAYQAVKTHDKNSRKRISQAETPGQAKRLGRKVKLRPDWEEVKLGIMEELVRQKFNRHEDLKNKIIDSGDIILVEGNSWGDIFWGICYGKGENHLGKILMKIRSELLEL